MLSNKLDSETDVLWCSEKMVPRLLVVLLLDDQKICAHEVIDASDFRLEESFSRNFAPSFNLLAYLCDVDFAVGEVLVELGLT